ncbi:J domain-containing protein DDB_G0295729-like [Chrysoperla carnea]|uniref:J domain-containing protein DDB_G0295729-like n=1 Tax=Chrysoperla carnea TaxID=189513 RepID=UPI001D05D933|nr:J domain-containing protein DDB_G0295729-like [Chrysoperla carnea]
MHCSRHCLEVSTLSAKKLLYSHAKYFKRFYGDGIKVTKAKNKNLINDKPTLRNKLPLSIQSLIQEAEIETTIVSNLVNYNCKPQLNRGENKFDVVVEQIRNNDKSSLISTDVYDEDITENEDQTTVVSTQSKQKKGREDTTIEQGAIEQLCQEDVNNVLEKYDNSKVMCERSDTPRDGSTTNADSILKSTNVSFNMQNNLETSQDLESSNFGKEIYNIESKTQHQEDTTENDEKLIEDISPLKFEHLLKRENLLNKKLLENISPLEDLSVNVPVKKAEELKTNFANQKKELEQIEKHPHESSSTTSETSKQILYNQSVLRHKPEDVIKPLPHRQNVMKFFDDKYNRTMEPSPPVKTESSIGTAEMFFTEVVNTKKLPLVDEEDDLKTEDPKITENETKIEPFQKLTSNHLHGQYKRQEQKNHTNEILRHFKNMMNPKKVSKINMKEIVSPKPDHLGQMVVDCLNGSFTGKSTMKKLSLKQVQMLADEMNQIAQQKRFEQRKFVPFKVNLQDLNVNQPSSPRNEINTSIPEMKTFEINANPTLNSFKIEEKTVTSPNVDDNNTNINNDTWRKWFQKSKNTKENNNSDSKIIGKMMRPIKPPIEGRRETIGFKRP